MLLALCSLTVLCLVLAAPPAFSHPKTIDYSPRWDEEVRSLAQEFSDERNILPDELHVRIVDTKGIDLRRDELVEEDRFPLQVSLAPWSPQQIASARRLEVPYDNWEENLQKAIADYAVDNSVDRTAFTVSVLDQRGAPVDRSWVTSKDQFPLHVKFVPKEPSITKTVQINLKKGVFAAFEWKKDVHQAMVDFADQHHAKETDVGMAVHDRHGKLVNSDDDPGANLFPLKVHLILPSREAESVEKAFVLDYRKNWREYMKSRMREFTLLHGIRPKVFSIQVSDINGRTVEGEDHLESHVFPLRIAFVPRALPSSGKVQGRAEKHLKHLGDLQQSSKAGKPEL